MTQKQIDKLDKCYLPFKIEDKCVEETVKARRLLGRNRFDLYAILLYIDHKVKGVSDLAYAKKIYQERIRAITGGLFVEDGKTESKNSFDAFIASLDKLIQDCLENKYDAERTLIPVDKDYSLIDGAHRVAVAAYFDLDINILRFEEVSVYKITQQYLQSKMLPEDIADAMALEATRWHDDLFVLFLWPKSYLYPQVMKDALRIIRDRVEVVYEKECKMSYQAIRTLMIQIYNHMDWVGTIDNDFESTYAKANEVWDENGKCRFLLVRAESCEYVLKLKSEIRDMFNIKLASMHSTDNMRETRIAANALFNPNSMHFLFHGQPTSFKTAFILCDTFKQALKQEEKNYEDFIIDTSMILAMYGIRNVNDLDYYKMSNVSSLTLNNPNIEMHDDSQQKYYDCPIDDLILIPQNYFTFNEIKFVSLERLLQFKKSRYAALNDSKDGIDIKAIENIINEEGKSLKLRLMLCKVALLRWKIRLRVSLSMFLRTNPFFKRIGLYDTLRNIRDLRRK